MFHSFSVEQGVCCHDNSNVTSVAEMVRWRVCCISYAGANAQKEEGDADNGINFLWFLEQRARREMIKELNELTLNIIKQVPVAISPQIAS